MVDYLRHSIFGVESSAGPGRGRLGAGCCEPTGHRTPLIEVVVTVARCTSADGKLVTAPLERTPPDQPPTLVWRLNDFGYNFQVRGGDGGLPMGGTAVPQA